MWASGKKVVGGGAFASRFYAYRGSSQTIPQNTWTQIEFNSEAYDNDSEYDHVTNYDFTAKAAGWYHFHANIQLIDLADGEAPELLIKKNGSSSILGDIVMVGHTGTGGVQCDGDVELAQNDVITVEVYRNETANKETRTGYACAFSGHRIA